MRRCLLVLTVAACTPQTSSGGGSTEGAPSTATTTASVDDTAATTGEASTGSSAPNYEERGTHGVGVTTMDLAGAQDRTLRVTVWYPTATADDVVPLSTLVTAEDVSTFEDLLANAPAGCTRPAMDATLDAPLAAGSYPAIVFSHCLSCLGTSSTFIAERLASHGAIVVGVTHTGDTLFDQVEGNVAPLDAAWLSVRALDVGLTLDGVLDSEQFGPAIDTTRLGVFGHSYGAATTGKVLQDDDRFIAGVAIAAPLANPLLPGVAVTDIAEPMLMLLAQEDNSITEIGNNFMRADAMALPGGSWLVELADAGHWSFSDLCGIVEAFDPGCGDGTRQTVAGEAFTYLDNDLARDIAASYTTAFFALHLHEQPDAEQYLDVATPASVVTVVRHDP